MGTICRELLPQHAGVNDSDEPSTRADQVDRMLLVPAF